VSVLLRRMGWSPQRRCCIKPSRDLDAADFPPRC
jgi:hypothetical protein